MREGQALTQLAIQEAPEDLGEVRGTMGFRILRTARGLTLRVGSSSRHALYAHEPTRPHWPPPDALVGWARRHGTKAFLVGRKIAREGTKGKPFLFNALRRRYPGVHIHRSR